MIIEVKTSEEQVHEESKIQEIPFLSRIRRRRLFSLPVCVSLLCLPSPTALRILPSPRFYFVFVAIVVVVASSLPSSLPSSSRFASLSPSSKNVKTEFAKNFRLDAESKENCDICILIKVQEFPTQQQQQIYVIKGKREEKEKKHLKK